MTHLPGASEQSFLARARAIGRWVGVDRAIFYTVLARGWGAISGPISILFVAQFLTREEQGFYYTFGSVLALQVFFELGLAYVIMQSVSHENAHLEWSADGMRVTGDPHVKGRLASYFRLALKWYAAIAVLASLVLAPIGFWFFGRYQPTHVTVHWELPWLLLVLFTAMNLLLTPLYGVLEGCGKVSEIAALHARQGVIGSVVFWLAMALQLKLYAAPLLSLMSVCVAVFWLFRTRRAFFADLIRTPIPEGSAIRWRQEVLPFQWRISLSWLSGFFIFQLANPVMFRYHGAVEAGRMGMTMRIIDSITALGFAWVSTKSAPFGGYIARREFATLDRIFKKAALQSVAVVVLGGAAFIAGYFVLAQLEVPLIGRLLDPLPTCFLIGTAIINCAIFSQAVYLRAHKQEPFLINSLVGAVLVPAVMYFLGRPYGAVGIAAGMFACGMLVGLPLATWIFYKKREQWH
jgi:hypothetical protein